MIEPTRDRRITAVIFALYFVLFMVAFFILAARFEFPDVLRTEPAYRFQLFQQHQPVIVAAYYVMVLTSVLQILMAIALYAVTPDPGMLGKLALGAGAAAGVFQIIGYIRWVVLIPVLSAALESGAQPPANVFFVENLANSFLGMGLGEHAGTLFLALWLILAAASMRSSRLISRGVRRLMSVTGWGLILVALEALGGPFTFIGVFSVALWGLLYVFVLLLVVSLLAKNSEETAPKIHWGYWVGAALFYGANVVPALMG